MGKNKVIASLLVVAVMMIASVLAQDTSPTATTTDTAATTAASSTPNVMATTGQPFHGAYKVATKNNQIVPTFHGGFSAGLRPAPVQCDTDIIVPTTVSDFHMTVRNLCETRNPRKAFCATYCVNKAEREFKSKRKTQLTQVPKAACANYPTKNYDSPESCLAEQLKHCSANCRPGIEQSKCSRQGQVRCRKLGVGNLFKPNAI